MLLNWRSRTLLAMAGLLAGIGCLAEPAWAVARYTGETGLGCAECHTLHPQLTPRMLAWRVAVKLEIPLLGDAARVLWRNLTGRLERLVHYVFSQQRERPLEWTATNLRERPVERAGFPSDSLSAPTSATVKSFRESGRGGAAFGATASVP